MDIFEGAHISFMINYSLDEIFFNSSDVIEMDIRADLSFWLTFILWMMAVRGLLGFKEILARFKLFLRNSTSLIAELLSSVCAETSNLRVLLS